VIDNPLNVLPPLRFSVFVIGLSFGSYRSLLAALTGIVIARSRYDSKIRNVGSSSRAVHKSANSDYTFGRNDTRYSDKILLIFSF
jgi:hypothetical protein